MPYVKFGRLTRKALQIGARFKEEPTIVDVSRGLAAASQVLICAADAADTLAASLDFAQELGAILPQAHLLLVSHSDFDSDSAATVRLNTVVITRDAINWLGLPKRQVFEQWHLGSFDLAIDLSLEFDLVNTQLCRKSGARLRTCLYHPHRDPFFNVQVRTAESMNVQQRYGAVLRCLKALLPQAQPEPLSEVLPT